MDIPIPKTYNLEHSQSIYKIQRSWALWYMLWSQHLGGCSKRPDVSWGHHGLHSEFQDSLGQRKCLSQNREHQKEIRNEKSWNRRGRIFRIILETLYSLGTRGNGHNIMLGYWTFIKTYRHWTELREGRQPVVVNLMYWALLLMLWVSKGRHIFPSPEAELGISPRSDSQEAEDSLSFTLGNESSPHSASLDPELFTGVTFGDRGGGPLYKQVDKGSGTRLHLLIIQTRAEVGWGRWLEDISYEKRDCFDREQCGWEQLESRPGAVEEGRASGWGDSLKVILEGHLAEGSLCVRRIGRVGGYRSPRPNEAIILEMRQF